MTEKERIELFNDFMRDYDWGSCDALQDMGFFTAPASTKYHGSYEGGLFDHSYEMAKALVKLTENNNLKWEHDRSPYIVGMFHDLCKVDNYRYDCSTGNYLYNTDTLLKGHGDKSVMLLSEFYSLTEEEILCIRYHMGAFTDKDEWINYTRAVAKYPNVLWTHTADMIASHVKGV